MVCVQGDNTGLIGLGDVGKDGIDHLDEHAVFLRVTGVFHDGYYMSAFAFTALHLIEAIAKG